MYDFNNLNPLVGFLYFTFVIFFSMIFTQPLFALAGLLCSFLAVIFLVGKSALNRLKYFIPLSILIAFINPIFNTKGDSVLFYLFGKRPYTLEALVYGMVLACIFLCAVNWFLCYGKVISSDKFLYIFGNILPSACLIINMILRLIPFYHRKLVQIEKDRDCIGLGERGKFKTAFTNFSVLLTQGLEGSISTSDSMKSRGYGENKRTSFSIYHLSAFDKTIMVLQLILTLFSAVFGFVFATKLEAFPRLILPPPDFKAIISLVSYISLMLLPTVTSLIKEIKWHFSISKI